MNRTETFRLPSVDEILRSAPADTLIARYGRAAVTRAVREALDLFRARRQPGVEAAAILGAATERLEAEDRPSQRPVINLTGTVLHTNLGRALLPKEAVEAVVAAMQAPTNLEYDIASGKRGERDAHVRGLIRELTGAEDAIIVNNNASAVLLVLNTFAKGKEAVVSRGELIEIGGAFRMPDIMTRAGAKLREVGTTNRTHLKDYQEAISPRTGLLMKVHTSNYLVQGFTAEVDAPDIAALARTHDVPFVDDLGSGTLIDLAKYGLRHEKTVQDALKGGADLVTFSGDKMLGGPQAGIIAGRKDLIAQLAKNPLKRALRMDKMRLAALEATLKLYRDPDRLPERLPTLRLFTRHAAEIRSMAERIAPQIAERIGADFHVAVIDCASQIGSGALPLETLPSAGISMTPRGKASGRAVERLAARFRALPVAAIGRIAEGALVFDLRCLADEEDFTRMLPALAKDRNDGLA